MDRRARTSLLKAVPLGEPLVSYAGPLRWGAWGRVGDGWILAIGSADGTVYLWDPIEGLSSLSEEPLNSIRTDEVMWGAWGHVGDQNLLATGTDGERRVWLWDPVERSPVAALTPSHAGAVLWGVWGRVAERSVLTIGIDDGTVELWDPAEGTTQLLEPLAGRTGAVRWGAWGRVDDRSVLATGSDDGTVRLWDPAGGTSPVELQARQSAASWGAWGRVGDRSVLAIGSDDGTVHLWDPRDGVLQSPAFFPGAASWGAWGWIDDRPVLATGGVYGHLGLWDPAAGVGADTQTDFPLPMATELPFTVSWGAWGRVGDRSVLVVGGDDERAYLWVPAEGSTPPSELPTGHTSAVRWGAWGRVGDRPVLATGGDSGAVRLWEVIEDKPNPWLPSYQSDITATTDELSRSGDAIAVAELVTARTARPPLAVGLFGDWGEGKSHFLGMLQQQVETVAQPTNPLAHADVRQVRFNAWHYAETDLWASLVAELFAQLATPPDGDRSKEQRRQSRLTADLVAERGLRQRLDAARERRDRLQQALGEPKSLWEGLPPEQRAQLRLLAGNRPEEVCREAARTVAALRATGRESWQLVKGVPSSTVICFLSLVVGLAAVTALGVWGLPALWRWVALLPGVSSVLAALWLTGRFVRAARARASAAWQAATRLGAQQWARLETAAEVAAAEVEALQRKMQDLTAAGQLAGMVTDRVAGADYRSRLGVMTQIRQDFERMAELLARSLHEPPAGSGTGSRKHSEASADLAGDELPRIDRIILYIDDLDRCPPRRVVEMLEAIHLLLAVDLFVVVVAVDPRWLLKAITAHYRDVLAASTTGITTEQGGSAVDPDDEELWHASPAQYLEKIFQVVLTLPPLDTHGYQRLMRTLVGPRPDQHARDPDTAAPGSSGDARPESATATPPHSTPANPPAAENGSQADTGLTGQEEWNEEHEVQLPAARVVERVDPLTLEPDELVLLDLLGPPLLVTTPRAVKRLANSYGLLTAIRRDHREDDLSEQLAEILDPITREPRNSTYRPYRAGMVMLAALVAYPALGPALFLHLHHTAAVEPYLTWEEFRRALTPLQEQARWHSAADPHMTPVQAQQWQALLQGLDHVSQAAREHGLPLPEPLSAWSPWIVPVGRLSFPTGRIVSTLDQHRPLTSERFDGTF